MTGRHAECPLATDETPRRDDHLYATMLCAKDLSERVQKHVSEVDHSHCDFNVFVQSRYVRKPAPSRLSCGPMTVWLYPDSSTMRIIRER